MTSDHELLNNELSLYEIYISLRADIASDIQLLSIKNFFLFGPSFGTREEILELFFAVMDYNDNM